MPIKGPPQYCELPSNLAGQYAGKITHRQEQTNRHCNKCWIIQENLPIAMTIGPQTTA
jgi:hypothetical protein